MKFIRGWLSLAISLFLPSLVVGGQRYQIEASVNDEKFIINGEVFEAKTYCFDMEEGDMVMFIEGNANGACASAKFINLRNGRICEVWCE